MNSTPQLISASWGWRRSHSVTSVRDRCLPLMGDLPSGLELGRQTVEKIGRCRRTKAGEQQAMHWLDDARLPQCRLDQRVGRHIAPADWPASVRPSVSAVRK